MSPTTREFTADNGVVHVVIRTPHVVAAELAFNRAIGNCLTAVGEEAKAAAAVGLKAAVEAMRDSYRGNIMTVAPKAEDATDVDPADDDELDDGDEPLHVPVGIYRTETGWHYAVGRDDAAHFVVGSGDRAEDAAQAARYVESKGGPLTRARDLDVLTDPVNRADVTPEDARDLVFIGTMIAINADGFAVYR